jgi:glycosyltransferase involved in cell wall biosynthesis
MKATITVDMAGGPIGGAARFRNEVRRYLRRSTRDDIKMIGVNRRLNPAWLVGREMRAVRHSRRVALNNVGFLAPGGERWTLLTNALHFLNAAEAAELEPGLLAMATRQAAVVYRAARRSDVLIAPCTAMAERVATRLPDVADRIVVRMHPVSAGQVPFPRRPDHRLVLCPVIFESYKRMDERLADWVAAARTMVPPVRLMVTAGPAEVPAWLAVSPGIELVGRLSHAELNRLWARSQAIYFPPGLESFGCALAEARVNGLTVIARDTAQNREIAGDALCGYIPGDPDSLRHAIDTALSNEVAPDPDPFDPDAYFDWMLGAGK